MKRRDFVKAMTAAGTGLLLGPPFALGELQQAEPDTSVKRVLVMFKCHFDAGFIDTQYNVVHHRYFEKFFPQAIDVARAANASGQRRWGQPQPQNLNPQSARLDPQRRQANQSAHWSSRRFTGSI